MITVSIFSLVVFSILSICVIGLFVLVTYLVFAMKALLREQHLCLAASFYSLAETRAMKNATVIQRLVEMHRPPRQVKESAEEIAEDFEGFMTGVMESVPKLPRWGRGDMDQKATGEDIYDPAKDPEFKGARDLV